jgi:DNA-binding transcriptional LysR family regulator
VREHVLAREPLVAVLPAAHRLAARKVVPVRALSREPFVLVRADVEPAWADASARALADAGVEVDVAQHADTKRPAPSPRAAALFGLASGGGSDKAVSEKPGRRRLGRVPS